MGAFGNVFGIEPLIFETQLLFSKLALTQIGTGDVIATPKIIKRWNVITDPSVSIQNLIFFGGVVQMVARRLTGVDSITIGIARSNDNGSTWQEVLTVNESGIVFDSLSNNNINSNFSDDTTDIAIIAINNDGATTGEIKEIKITMRIDLPFGTTVVDA